MGKKDIRLKKYNISSARYRELKYFCLQYEEWKSLLALETSALKAVLISDMPSSHGISDLTELIGIKRAEVSEKCSMIEQTAIEANSEIYAYIIKNVTQEISYEYMDVPCGRRQFYEARRKFFYILSKKR